MLLVKLMPLGRNLLVQLFAEFQVLGLFGVVRANIHRVFSPLAVIIEIAVKISGNEQLAMWTVEKLFDLGYIFIVDTLLLILAAFAFVHDDVAMAVLVYKRIDAQPFEVALAQAEELFSSAGLSPSPRPLPALRLNSLDARIGFRMSLIAMPVALQIGTR